LVLGPIVAVFGIALAIGAVLMLPSHANLFGGMLVISPLNSLFKIICLRACDRDHSARVLRKSFA